MNKVKIGIIGRGFVGSAVANGFSPNTGFTADLKIYDTDPSRSFNSASVCPSRRISLVANRWDIGFSTYSPMHSKNRARMLNITPLIFIKFLVTAPLQLPH